MEFKELTLEELIQGYVRLDEEQAYQCIFCGIHLRHDVLRLE